MSTIIPFTVHLDIDLKTKFTTFFKDRNLSFDSALDLLIRDFLLKHSARNINQAMDKHDLSKREKEIALLVLKGFEVKEISNKLFISKDTTHTHIKNIYRKCNVKNKVQLVNILNDIRYE